MTTSLAKPFFAAVRVASVVAVYIFILAIVAGYLKGV